MPSLGGELLRMAWLPEQTAFFSVGYAGLSQVIAFLIDRDNNLLVQ